jgi:parallel beta-helix repeat protein
MPIQNYNDPLVIAWNTDSNGNKISIQITNEEHKVVNNKFTLSQIPDPFNKVQIQNLFEIKNTQQINSENQFKVDYTTGEITFHSSKEAQNIIITQFYGRGIIYYPSSRIYTELDDFGNVKETLANIFDKSKVIYKTPVATFPDIAITYPTPQIGWATQVEENGRFYRWDGSSWVYFQILHPTQLPSIFNEINEVKSDFESFKSDSVYYVTHQSGVDKTGVIDSIIGLQAASNLLNSLGGGTLKFPKGVYRITSTLILYSNITLDLSDGATLLLDFAGTSGIKAYGTYGSAIPVTSDVIKGSINIDVNTTGLQVGDLIQLDDNRHVGRQGKEMGFIKSLTPTSLTMQSKICLSYLTTYSASVYKVSGLKNVKIIGGTIECSNSADITYPIDIRNAIDVNVDGVTIKNHRTPSAPATGITCFVRNCYNVSINNVRIYGVADNTIQNGDAINVFASNKALITNNKCVGVPFGICCWTSVGNIISNNIIESIATNGNRGIKIAGCFYTTISNNTVIHADTGIKHEDSGRNIIKGNKFLFCGLEGAGSAAIGCSNQNISVEKDFIMLHIEGNTIFNQIGNGIVLDNQYDECIVIDNIIDTTTIYGIISNGIKCKILNNTIKQWGSYGLVFQPDNTNVSGNTLYHSDNTKVGFYLLSTTNANNCIFTNNHSINNPVSLISDFLQIGVSNNNRILGYNVDGFTRISNLNNTIKHIGESGSISIENTKSITFTTGNTKFFTIQAGGGQAALVFTDYKSSTITLLSNPSNLFVASATPSTGMIGISKST